MSRLWSRLSKLGSPSLRAVIARAVERGDAPPSVDPISVSEVFPALAFHRGAALGKAVDDDFVVRVADQLLLPLLR